MKVRVKICGITSSEALTASVEAGADAVGFVLGSPPSPRDLPLEKARELLSAVPDDVEKVLVTANRDMGWIAKTASELGCTEVQVHGFEGNELSRLRRNLSGRRLVGAVTMRNAEAIKAAASLSSVVDAILLDSHVEGVPGGTGKTHDWVMSRKVRDAIAPKPMILAGGLTPRNVAAAIRKVKPFGVDVSSGVESRPGVKDLNLIRSFLAEAKGVTID